MISKEAVEKYGHELMDEINEHGFIHEYTKTLKDYFENIHELFEV